jgi:hypothetical protein
MINTLWDFLRDTLFVLPFSLIVMLFVMYLLRHRSRVQTLELESRSRQPETPQRRVGHPTKVEFGPCCFCGKDVEPSKKEPCRLTVETREGLWQMWVCHAHCFRERLWEDSLLEPVHF